jgi:2-(1,2-epoxy-1,2-dihydrophenyl)acetyl-CoA isomerase
MVLLTLIPFTSVKLSLESSRSILPDKVDNHMSQDGLELEMGVPIATITFNRPDKANAIGVDWPRRMLLFLREARDREEVRCVLFRAVGKHFQAGGDLEALSKSLDGALHEQLSKLADGIVEWNQMVREITRLPKPVVASVQGGAVGGSIGIIGACDLVIASDDAFFLLAQGKNGYTLDGMPSYFLPRQIGPKKAMEWAFLGRRVPATEVARLGLINFVVPRDRLEAETQKLVQELASGPTRAHALNKQLINQSLDNSFESQGALEMDSYMIGGASEDWREGTLAFIEKRSPVFKGR